MASEKILNQKKEEVSKLAAKIKEAKVVLLTDYRGINVSDVTDLRTKLRGAEVEYKVITCNICSFKHYFNMKDWDKWNKSDACCKCIIF